MGRVRWYIIAALAFLMAIGILAWQTWPRTSPGQFDPVGTVAALANLAVSIVAFRQGVRAQRQADTDVTAAAARLAVAVCEVETEARRQLLGGHDRTIDVEFVLQPAPTHNAAGSTTKGLLQEVVDYYRRLHPRRMVITGVAGSGKTVLAVELILGLLKGRADDDPVPVRMSAALLDTSRPPETAVREWLVEHLTRTFRLPAPAARQLVAARMVLPVLDGLDEMDAANDPDYTSRTAQTIRACNAYLDGTGKASLVLTCRIDQYQALERSRVWVHDAARVKLRPVGLPKARTFLIGRVTDEGRWQPVLNAIRRGGNRPLAKALSTPWRLTLAATVYEQQAPDGAYLRDPAELTAAALDSEDKIRDHLLGLFIPTVTAVHHSPYPADHVHRWLGTLARYLDANTRAPRRVGDRLLSGTDLVLHELWPLAGTRAPRAIPALFQAAVWAGFIAYTLAPVPIGSAPHQLVGGGIGALAAPFFIYWTWAEAWPPLARVSVPRIRTRSGIRKLASELGYGIVLGLAFGIMAWLAVGVAFGIVAGLAFGIVAWLAVGVAVGPTVDDYLSAEQPHGAVEASIVAGAVVGLMPVLMFGLMFGLVVGLVVGLVGGVSVGVAGWRYASFLLCTRRWSNRWLPWRLGKFLHSCYDAGLVRIAGIGYQFRHRELQDYLTSHPTP